MLLVTDALKATDLLPACTALWELSGTKIRALEAAWAGRSGAPVFTAQGLYTSQAWTEWTLGFRYGSALLQFDATGDRGFLELARAGTARDLPGQITHFGVHDHGFNIVSTYGNLWRLHREDRLGASSEAAELYALALRCSGAVQAHRWTQTAEGGGFIHSFHGRHSLFIDTMRSLRSLALAHRLGQGLIEDNDRRVSLLTRLLQHAVTTATWNVFYGRGRDLYDVRGRVAQESLFNADDGRYRCPSTQQGFSPFTTWTRGLAWAVCGFAEQLEFLAGLPAEELAAAQVEGALELITQAARATADYYLQESAADGIPYWDTGAPGLQRLPEWREAPADPFNPFEPVDSSAAAIACQGLLRLGRWLQGRGEADGQRYVCAGLGILQVLLAEPYLSADPEHQGLLLHSVYHRPNGWDYVPPTQRLPCGESSQWGDYHLREAALYVQRLALGQPYLTFWGPDT